MILCTESGTGSKHKTFLQACHDHQKVNLYFLCAYDTFDNCVHTVELQAQLSGLPPSKYTLHLLAIMAMIAKRMGNHETNLQAHCMSSDA